MFLTERLYAFIAKTPEANPNCRKYRSCQEAIFKSCSYAYDDKIKAFTILKCSIPMSFEGK